MKIKRFALITFSSFFVLAVISAMAAEAVSAAAKGAASIQAADNDSLEALIEYYRLAPGIVGGDKNKARALAAEVVKLDPVRGYISQAAIAHQEDKNDRREELYKKAVDSSHQSYHAMITLARSYSYGQHGNIELVQKYAAEALRLDPGRIAAYGLLAQSYVRQGRWQELDDLLSRAEENVPDNLNPYFQAGRIVFQQGKDFERAERYFRKYLTQEPEPSSASHAQAFWRLGQTLEKLNRKTEAVEAIKTALKLDRSLEGAKKDLKRLR